MTDSGETMMIGTILICLVASVIDIFSMSCTFQCITTIIPYYKCIVDIIVCCKCPCLDNKVILNSIELNYIIKLLLPTKTFIVFVFQPFYLCYCKDKKSSESRVFYGVFSLMLCGIEMKDTLLLINVNSSQNVCLFLYHLFRLNKLINVSLTGLNSGTQVKK